MNQLRAVDTKNTHYVNIVMHNIAITILHTNIMLCKEYQKKTNKQILFLGISI